MSTSLNRVNWRHVERDTKKTNSKIIFNRRLIPNRDMTFIIGFQTLDGVVIVADKKITRGDGQVSYEQKIFQDVDNIIYAAAGPTGLFDKFRRKIVASNIKNSEKYAQDAENFVKDVEDIVYELNQKYLDRINYQPLELLIGMGQTTRPHLQHITPRGVGQMVRNYQPIGSGSPYGSLFVKMAWTENLDSLQCAALGYFIIKLIEGKELDSYVGVKDYEPTIAILPNAPDDYSQLTKEEQDKYATRTVSGDELAHIKKIATQEYVKFDNYFKTSFVNLFQQAR